MYAKDVDGREKTERIQFSLDGTKMSFGVLSRLALMSNLSYIVSLFSHFYLDISLVLFVVLVNVCNHSGGIFASSGIDEVFS